jgi:transposase-like protein
VNADIVQCEDVYFVMVERFKNLVELMEVCSSEEKCRLYLEQVRWNGSPVCPHCGSQHKKHYQLKVKGVFKGLRKCKDCRERFTVTVGTMFEGSHISLKKWFIGMYIFSAHKKGISSHQLARDLGIGQKAAWFMLGRIRHCFDVKPHGKITGEVQADECFVGGKNKNRHANKKVKESQDRSVKDKTPVFGLLDHGYVNTQVVPNTKGKTLKPIIEAMVEKGAILITDEWGAYNGLKKDYHHEVIKHKANQYVNENGFSTNALEGFWSLLKRGIDGIYHHVSPKHLNEYCDEFAFRYNTRNATDADRFDLSLFIARDHITYKELTKKI